MIKILTTGGTIASKVDPRGGARPVLGAAELAAAVPGLGETTPVEVEEFACVPGDYMGPDLWQPLSRRVAMVLAVPETAGVVITHGTDTLEETAYFLHLTVAGPRPVVLTGAQRNASELSADGPRNLQDAVQVAADPQAGDRGTMVVFAGRIHGAHGVVKAHTWALDAFDSGDRGLLGEVTGGRVSFFRPPGDSGPGADHRRTFNPDRLDPGVEIVAMYGGADARLMDAAVAGGATGLVIQGLGAGNANGAFYQAVLRAREQGIAVVVATRVQRGPVLPLYSFPGGGRSLADAGALPAGDLSPQKARIALMLALGESRDPDRLQEIWAQLSLNW